MEDIIFFPFQRVKKNFLTMKDLLDLPKFIMNSYCRHWWTIGIQTIDPFKLYRMIK